jgi:methylated-DNA-[protein]-cysteine S-methyltransferase
MKSTLDQVLFHKFFSTPVGRLKLVASGKGLVAILWENDSPDRVKIQNSVLDENNFLLNKTETQLKEYFQGKRSTFDISLDFNGTDFQKEVWQALLQIPYGETRSYKDIAVQINRPFAIRAVGAANGKNPISIIAACHRVIGSNGALTGFAGGLNNKKFLLNLEMENSVLESWNFD